MTRNAVGWFEIYVNDIEKAVTFYESVFGVSLEKIPMDMSGMDMRGFPMDDDAQGAPGAIVQMKGVEAGNNSTMVYFSSEDCTSEQSRVEAAGGKVVHEKFPVGNHGFVCVAQDPDGNTIGIHSNK